MPKTEQEYFADWESHVFGYGYGSGEEHVIEALQNFMGSLTDGKSTYDYRKLEVTLGATVTWLLINTLCEANIIEYGTSARFGWLTKQGENLKKYLSENMENPLISMGNDPDLCLPTHCNCQEHYDQKPRCDNPFWVPHGR